MAHKHWGDLAYKLQLLQCLDFEHNQDIDTRKDYKEYMHML